MDAVIVEAFRPAVGHRGPAPGAALAAHFDLLDERRVFGPCLAQNDALLKRAQAVVFCLAEYAEALPSIVAILLEWAVAVGFLTGKWVAGSPRLPAYTPGARPAKHLIGP